MKILFFRQLAVFLVIYECAGERICSLSASSADGKNLRMAPTHFARHQIVRCIKDGKNYTVCTQLGCMVSVYELCGREIHASNLRLIFDPSATQNHAAANRR